MPNFSNYSKQKLQSCHNDLQIVMNDVVEIFDIKIAEGHRGEADQNRYFNEGFSKLKFPNSKHNSYPSLAVDVDPFPINFNLKERYYYMAGIVKMVALKHGIAIRWGGDWDSDNDFYDQTLYDLRHFELVV